MIDQTLSGSWQVRQIPDGEWYPASVPGSVHLDLLNAGKIPDPFFGDNEKAVQWVAESDWEYRRTFTLDPRLLKEQRVFLVCDGLDTLATIRMNGKPVGTANNMFRTYTWDVRPFLRERENEISIQFSSPVKYTTSRNEDRYLPTSLESIEGSVYLRKAAYHFGWDWGPRLPSVGIWRSIHLTAYSHACLNDVHIRQFHEPGRVSLSARITPQRFDDHPLTARVTVESPDGKRFQADAPINGDSLNLEIPVENHLLWWPNGYGDHPLYSLTVSLMTEEILVDSRKFSVGLRKLELRQEPDHWGRSFSFFVNDVPVFIKGANWIPVDVFSTRVTEFNREHLVRSAALANMNMLRVWGGGLYANEHFFDLCDQYGILVWHDFMFACGIYPLNDPEFAENVQLEVVEILRRFRHRACLALWCGNNEMEWGWTEWGWDTTWWTDLKEAYDEFFHRGLPQTCAVEDPDHSYWPSSPSSGTPFVNPNGEYQGDTHYWEVWHQRKPFSAYKDVLPRFMSEFGFQSLPPMETIQTYALPEEWNLTSYTMEHHQRSKVGNDLIISQMAAHYRIPKDFRSTVYMSMVLQAEGIRMGVEHWRRNKSRVSGTLFWQLNDVWPVASWSSIDYYGRWKALQYAARRFYAPLLVSVDQNGTAINVWLTSDLQVEWEGEVEWTLQTLSGEILDAGTQAVGMQPLESRSVLKLDYLEKVHEGNQRDLFWMVRAKQANQEVSRSLVTFVPDKHLHLKDPELAVEILPGDEGLRAVVKASSLARFIEITVTGHDFIASDNYFDLCAGESKAITLSGLRGGTPEEILSRVRLVSLFDSYKS